MTDETQFDARELAIHLHGNQTYGNNEPYVAHLDRTYQILEDHGFDSDDYYDAAYLHDTVEDTDFTIVDVHQAFGPEVSQLVAAVTGEGINRRERQANILQKIRAYPAAAPLKLADRIANVERGDKNMMYREENEAFSEVIEPLVPVQMFARYLMLLDTVNAERN